MSVHVFKPGFLTTLQDLGRYGLQHMGIVPGGAMDPIAHRIANALVANTADAATLECTVVGPELSFEEDALVALYGAEFDAHLGQNPFPLNRPVLLKPGSRLKVGSVARNRGDEMRGARAYLAVAGGFAVPMVLGSRSTFAPAGWGGFGGFGGRALKSGDHLPLAANAAALAAERFAILAGANRRRADACGTAFSVRWSVPVVTLPSACSAPVHALEGRHFDQFDAASQRAFFGEEYRIAADSNRMGYRLCGPILGRRKRLDILSEPTCLGTVQVPNDGAPILLMADHQTTGGYPKIAEIAGADISRLAQFTPGERVRFVKCTLEDAEFLRKQSREQISMLTQIINKEYTS
jgi:antagonist of KipI